MSLENMSLENMALVETGRDTRESRGRDTALADWLRALEATAPIAKVRGASCPM